MTTDNMRVINEVYEQMVDESPSGNVIMSDGLKELMGLDFDQSRGEVIEEENKLSIIMDPPDTATITGNLHSLKFGCSQEPRSFTLEVSKCNSEIMQALHESCKRKDSGAHLKTVNIVLTGDTGFEAEDCAISSFGVTKVAAHTFLLTITFESEHVTF